MHAWETIEENYGIDLEHLYLKIILLDKDNLI